MTNEIDAVNAQMTGQFLVETEGDAAYLLDLVAWTVRMPGYGPAAVPRRAGDTVALHVLEACRVGSPLIVHVDLDLPGIALTIRLSTPIVRITPTHETVVIA